MSFKSDFLALLFGALLVFVTFGDDHIGKTLSGIEVGNLDTIFGLRLWPVLDVIYPLASIAVFLGYGWSKSGRFRNTRSANVLLGLFLLLLAAVNIDDIFIVTKIAVDMPQLYWNVVSWVYPLGSSAIFFLFGRIKTV